MHAAVEESRHWVGVVRRAKRRGQRGYVGAKRLQKRSALLRFEAILFGNARGKNADTQIKLTTQTVLFSKKWYSSLEKHIIRPI